MNSEAQLKADKKWRDKRKKDGWIKFTVFTSTAIAEKLRALYQQLRKQI